MKLNKVTTGIIFAFSSLTGFAHTEIPVNDNGNEIKSDTVLQAPDDRLREQQYATIKNIRVGDKECLTLNENNKTVEFRECRESERQLWQLSPIMTGYLKITNKLLDGGATSYCLGADATMIACSGSGYTSQRSWKTTANLNTPVDSVILENKYRNDLGKKEVLGYSNNQLSMVPKSSADNVSWVASVPVVTPTRPLTGEKRVLLLHTHYSDKPATNLEAAKKAVFGSGNDYASLAHAVRIASAEKLLLTGDTVTDLNLGPSPATCSSSVVEQAKSLARQKGVNPDSYDFVFVDIPQTSCSWSGLAQTPGWWIIANGSSHKPWLWQHEFGHNFGAPHATSLENCGINDKGVMQIDASCKSTSTSDPSDTLNGGGSRLYPAPYLFYSGWLTEAQFPAVTQSGSYVLTPLFEKGDQNEIKGLRIPRRDGSYMTLEYRQPLQGFENWDNGDPFVNGVIVRIARFGGTVSNTLVDTTPGSAGGMKDAPLMPGKVLEDVLSGKRIKLSHIDGLGAHIQVQDINAPDDEVEVAAPVAVVPQGFSVVSPSNHYMAWTLDGSGSLNVRDIVWTIKQGAGTFWLQEHEGGGWLRKVEQSVARALIPAGSVGQATYELTVTGNDGSRDSKTVTVSILPASSKIIGSESVEQGQSITLSSQENFSADMWLWSLKRAGQVIVQSSQPAFAVNTSRYPPGDYQVQLDVSAQNGQYVASASKALTITAKPGVTLPEYTPGVSYQAGDRVSAAGGVYECKPWPYTGWCSGAEWAYAPGTGAHWQDAWLKVQ